MTAGIGDDNADFGEHLAYRQRRAGLPVRVRDICKRDLLEVTDTQGRPLHDADVAVQRHGVAQPLTWARTDTAGRAVLARGQRQPVQVHLPTAPQDQRRAGCTRPGAAWPSGG